MENSGVIYTVEPLCVGVEHSQINYRFLRMLLQIESVSEVRFYGESRHIHNVLQSFNAREGKKIEGFACRVSLVKAPHLFFSSIYKISKIAFESRQSKMPIVFLSCNKYLLLIIKVAALISGKSVLIILHGFISELKYKGPKIVDLKRLMEFGRGFINFFYISNGDFVCQNLLREVPKISNNTFSINLPISDCGQNPLTGGKLVGTIKIGCAGVACKTKGSDSFFMIANSLQWNNKIKFVYIGAVERLHQGFIEYYGQNVRVYREQLSDSEYENLFAEIHFIVFCYPVDAYDYGFSGVFLDAIRFCKPILALKNNLFSFYFRKYGEMGWLFDDLSDLEEFIANIQISGVETAYQNALANLEKARSQFHSDVVAGEMAELLKRIN